MKKELIIAAKFDTTDMDKTVDRLQQKLKDLYAPSDMVRAQTQTAARLGQMGFGGIMGSPGQGDQQRANMQTRRELDAFIREQAQGQEKLTKLMVKRSEKLEQMKTQQKDLVRGSREELEIKEKIARIEENRFKQQEFYKQRDAVLNQSLDAKQRMNLSPQRLIDAYKGGGFGGMATAGGRMMMQAGPGAMIGGLGSAIGSLGYGIQQGAELYRGFGRAPIETAAAMGGATQSTLGRDVNNIYGRRTAFEMPFMQERARAAQMAMEAMRTGRAADTAGLGGNILMRGGAGMAAGAGAGALLGSVVPGLGTAVGAGIGGAVGGFGGAASSIVGAMGDERKRSAMLAPMSKTMRDRYESILAEQMGKDYESSIEAQKKQNPFKTAAVGEYEQNFMRNLQAQRTMGLGNEGFYGKGGFMGQNIGAGFTPEMGLEMAGQIQGAGGSTRMARSAVFGNQLQRGLGLTNAGQVLGNLSGGIGGDAASQNATIKILAEGMKLGLDDSKFAEENRRFTAAAAEIISRSGAGGDADFQRNSRNFSQFMGENTNRGIEAAKTAYEQYQQISSTTTGPRGVMRAAGFMKDKYLSQLSTIEKTSLMQVPEEDLNANNPLVAGLAEKVGTSPEDFVNRIKGVNQGAVSRFREADIIRDRLRSKGVDVSRTGDPAYFASLPAQDRQDVTQLMSYQNAELSYQGQREMISRASGTVGRPEQFGPAAGPEAVMARMGAPTGRMEDTTIAAMAGDASTVLKNFNSMRDGMLDAAKAAAAFTDQIRELNAQLIAALQSRDVGAAKSILQKIATIQGNQVQPQGAKTAN